MGNFQIRKFTKILIFHIFQIFFSKTTLGFSKNPVRGMLSRTASMDTEMDTLRLESNVRGHHIDYIRIYEEVC